MLFVTFKRKWMSSAEILDSRLRKDIAVASNEPEEDNQTKMEYEIGK